MVEKIAFARYNNPNVSGKRSDSLTSKDIIREKINEAVASVLPITVIVAVICLFFVPLSNGLLLSFLIGSLMLIVGMGFLLWAQICP